MQRAQDPPNRSQTLMARAVDKQILDPAVFKLMSGQIFDRDRFPDQTALEQLVLDVFAASAEGEEGIYLNASLIVLAKDDNIERWRHFLYVAAVHTEGFGNLGTSLRRHAPLLRIADYAFVTLKVDGPSLVGVATTKSHPFGRADLLNRLQEGKSVLLEIFGPLHLRFDSGFSSILIQRGRYKYPATSESDTADTLEKVTTMLNLHETAQVVLERLVDTLRLARHGALYVIADEKADLTSLFPHSLAADWNVLPLYVKPDGLDQEPTKIVTAYAGFGMMDGAVVLGRDLSLRRYRAYYPIETKKQVEGGGRSRAYAALEEKVKNPESGLLAVIKISTDGELHVATRPDSNPPQTPA
jgi:hypothetical protein